MFYYECRKLLCNRTFVIFLLLSIICNCFAIQWDYNQKSKEAYVNGEEIIYSMDFEKAQWAEQVKAYPEHIEMLLKDIDNKMQSPLYKISYASQMQYLQQSRNQYERLQNKQIQGEDTIVESYIFDFSITSYLFLFVLCMICYRVFIEEFESGTSQYLVTLRKGQHRLALIKCLTAILFAVISYLLITISSMITTVLLIRTLQPQNMIQAVRGFLDAPYQMTILQYFLLLGMIKITFIIFFTAMFSCIANITKSVFYSFAIIGTLIASELLLYTIIRDESYLVFLKQINMMMLYFVHPMFQQYLCVQLFGYAIPIIYVMVILAILLSIILFAVGLYAFPKQGLKKITLPSLWKRSVHTHSLLFYETYKLGYLQKACVVLIVFAFVQYMQVKAYHPFLSVDQYYYQVFSKQLQGRVRDDKDAWILEQDLMYDNNEKEKKLLGKAFNENRISEAQFHSKMADFDKISVSYEGYKKAKNQYEYIKANKGVYIDQSAFEALLHKDAFKQYILQGIILLIVLFFALRSIICVEYESHIQPLLMTTRYRMRKIFLHKICLSMIYAAFLYGITIWANVYIPFQYLEGDGLQEGIRNVLLLNTTSSFPIFMHFICVVILGYLIILLFIYLQSRIAKHVQISGITVICSFLCLLPLFLLYLFI